MINKRLLVLAVVGSFMLNAQAHFQMLYTPESALDKGTTIPLRLVFTHPFSDEHTMDMGFQEDGTIEPIENFYVIHKDKKTDLKETLQSIDFKGSHNSGKAYATDFKARKMGDYIFVLEPSPYYEANEQAYIQQITKMITNVAGAPSGWDAELGLKAEIVPLMKPYSIWSGSTFSGIVKSNGEPVPFADVEVEYVNHDINLDDNATVEQAHVVAPQDSFVTLGIKADANGEFTFGIPKAGWWGFAALGVGPDTEYKGKELSQDAVIWIQAKEMQ